MAFDFNKPAFNTNLISQEVRDNFQALSTHHEGSSAPTSPQNGYSWLDTTDSSNWKLKFYTTSGWVIYSEHMESVPIFGEIALNSLEQPIEFYEGNVPPLFINIDDYNFEDAAGFRTAVDNDIIFRIEPRGRYTNGFKLRLKYCMSMADTGLVKFRLDYRLKIIGGAISGGSDYSSIVTIDPVNTADLVAYNEDISVPSSILDETIEVAHFRLTRQGSDVGDTHGGIFCLFGFVPKVT